MALQKVVKAVMKAAPVAAQVALPLPSSPSTSHTGELGRAFRRAEAVRSLKQQAGSGRATSGGHRPTPAKNQVDYGAKRSTTPNTMKAAGHTGPTRKKPA